MINNTYNRLLATLKSGYDDECIIWGDGYYRMSLNGVLTYAHHVAWAEHNGRPPLLGYQIDGNYWVVAHKCDHKGCVNPRHIENVTQSKNILDAYERGLVKADISEIRRRVWRETPQHRKDEISAKISDHYRRKRERKARDARKLTA